VGGIQVATAPDLRIWALTGEGAEAGTMHEYAVQVLVCRVRDSGGTYSNDPRRRRVQWWWHDGHYKG
jgi:hypothetical protein